MLHCGYFVKKSYKLWSSTAENEDWFAKLKCENDTGNRVGKSLRTGDALPNITVKKYQSVRVTHSLLTLFIRQESCQIITVLYIGVCMAICTCKVQHMGCCIHKKVQHSHSCRLVYELPKSLYMNNGIPLKIGGFKHSTNASRRIVL